MAENGNFRPKWPFGPEGDTEGLQKMYFAQVRGPREGGFLGLGAMGALGRNNNPQGATGVVNFTASGGAIAPPKL